MCSSFFDDLWDARGCNFFAENPKEAKKKRETKDLGVMERNVGYNPYGRQGGGEQVQLVK